MELDKKEFDPVSKRGNSHKHSKRVIVKPCCMSSEAVFNGGKKVKGHKRHIVVDILGNLLLVVKVHAR